MSQTKESNETQCPYLDTIDRKCLDFDFERVCCVSLAKTNIYACLVCGKYFQGRGKSTHAYTHSVRESHHVYLNMQTCKFYCLPDNYEINDPSFNDIIHLLKPTFSKEDIASLDKTTKPVRAYDGKLYYPGIVGLNNLKYNDYCNVIFHALSHIIPLRNYFLDPSFDATSKNQNDERYVLMQRFGELLRKIWNQKNFKAHVSPHEMLQGIGIHSKKKFEFTKQGDPILFLNWFLSSLLGPKREKCSILKQCIEGKLRVYSKQVLSNELLSDGIVPLAEDNIDNISFLYLTLDLPPLPLYPNKDANGQVLKPQVSIYELLTKFDGVKEFEYRSYKDTYMQRFEILRLPQYLIIYIKRFAKNDFFVEKKTHIIDFPMKNLNMTNFLSKESKQRQSDSDMFTYNLIANIIHDGLPDPGKGTYRIHVLHRGTGKWFELQDLYVTELSDTSLIKLSECYIQVWELSSEQSAH